MRSQDGHETAVDAKLAELLRAVDDDREFLRAQGEQGQVGMDLARALQRRGAELLARATATAEPAWE